MLQIARADGGSVDNALTQLGTVQQTGNNVNLEGGFTFGGDLSGPLTPRSANYIFSMKRNAARNFSSASQEQSILQSAEGGVTNPPTENVARLSIMVLRPCPMMKAPA